MWRDAGYRLVTESGADRQISADQLRVALASGFPWHDADRGHPELSTPDLWWESVYRRYSDAFRELGHPELSSNDVLSGIRRDILDATRYSLFEDVLPVLEQLQRAGWRQIVVSNHVPELQDIVDALGLGRFFRSVITSGVVGYEKPHPRMFVAAMAQTVADRPIWMVGDNLVADCQPVGAFGVTPILVRSAAAFERRTSDLWGALEIITR
jgi:putative hydrolase of the HAD superfamily